MSAVADPAVEPAAESAPTDDKKASEKLANEGEKKRRTQTRADRIKAADAAGGPKRMPTDKELRAEREAAVAARKKGGTDKPKRADDPLTQLSWAMTALCTGGSAKDAASAKGPITFGAPFNTTQVRELQEKLKGKEILKTLGGVSEAQLRKFATGDIKRTDLPEATRTALKELTGSFDPKRKMWPRKVAGGCLVLHLERKKKSAPKK